MALGDVDLHLVRSMDEVAEFKRWLGERRPVLALDTETEGLIWNVDRLRLVQFGDANSAWAIPWERWRGAVHEALDAYDGELVGHNLKFDAHHLKWWGGIDLPWHRCHDTMVLAHLDAPDLPVGLKPLAERRIDRRAATASRVLDEAMRQQKWTWKTVPVDFEPYWAYGCLDTVLTARLFEDFADVRSRYDRVYDLEMAVMRVILEMEHRGVHVDVEYTQRVRDELERYVEQVEAWCVEVHGVKPGSNQAVADRLIELGVELRDKTPTGRWKLDKHVLLAADSVLATQVYRRRRALKLVSTYLDNLLATRCGDRIYPDVRQLGARTGRMSMSRPTLHNLPRGRIVRGAFVPDGDDEVLLSCDYDQVEMRLLAHFSGDERMLEGIRYGDAMRTAGYAGYDLHSMNARGIYGLPLDQPVPAEQRHVTKNAGFAKAYGAGLERFCLTAGVPIEVGRAFLDQYDRTFPGVRRYQREVEQLARERLLRDGRAWVTSPIGRYHPAEDGREYALVNYEIQGTAADVFKEGLVRLDNAGLGGYLRVLVHDETILSVPRADVAEVRPAVEAALADLERWRVPLTVECSAPLERWGDKYTTSEFDAAEMVYAAEDD